jgi:acetylglutamate kinase
VPAVSTPAASAGLVVGKKRPPKAVAGEAEPVDYGLVADVALVQPKLLEALWSAGFVPLLSSLVCDADGQLLNLNADSLVTALVQALRIDDVILVTGVPGVYRDLADPSTHLPELWDRDIAGLIASGAVQGGMVAKLEEVAAILKKGADRVALVGFQQEHAIAAALQDQPGLRTVVRRSPA